MKYIVTSQDKKTSLYSHLKAHLCEKDIFKLYPDRETNGVVVCFEPGYNAYYYLTHALAEIIIEDLQIKFIYKRICLFNPKLHESLLNDITVRVLKTLWVLPDGHNCVSEAKHEVGFRLLKLLSDGYVEETLNLEGFMYFRMKDFLLKWQNSVENIINDLVDESVYNEFISVLNCFVQLREPQINSVHIFCDGEDFRLTDDNANEICLAEMETVSWLTLDMTSADALLSTLINLCPLQITVHNITGTDKKSLISTIERIFCGKVRFISN